MTPELGSALFATVAAMERLGIRYALVGGLAVGAWGVNRSTRDVDLYADLAFDTRKKSKGVESQRVALERALRTLGFDVPAMEEELERFGVFRSRSPEGVFVDIFNAVGPLGDAILERRREIIVGERSIWLIAPDDLAVLKAFSDRERDFEDLVNLTSVLGAKLDVEYVQRWARQLDASIGCDDVSERVSRAIARNNPKKTKRKRSPK